MTRSCHREETLDCGSLLPLSAASLLAPPCSNALPCSQQAATQKAAAGCRSPRGFCRLLVLLLLLCGLFANRALAAEGSTEAQLPESTTQTSDSDVQAAVQDVLADPEYRHLLPKAERKLPGWLDDFLRWLFTPSPPTPATRGSFSFGSLGTWFLYLVLFVGAIYLAVLLAKAASDWESKHRIDFGEEDPEAALTSTPPGELSSNEYERRALALAGRGEFKPAVRELVLGSMSWIERAGHVRFRCGLTNRDYVRAVWRQPDRRESLLSIVGIFERLYYGRRLADAAQFDSCLTAFRASFQAASEEEVAHASGTK